MYLTSVAEVDVALRDCWRRITESRSRRHVEACEVYLAQLDRLLDIRLQLRRPTPAFAASGGSTSWTRTPVAPSGTV